jgi:cytochrome c-type biogenesis protein
MSIIYLLTYPFWLGLLTSISPCPLATNIAAIAFVGKDIKNRKKMILSGLIYTLFRALTYTVIGILFLKFITSQAVAAHFLQKNMIKVIGPIMILLGMILLELISFPGVSFGGDPKFQEKIKKMDLWGAAFLGFIFALSFCPISGALFFSSLLPFANTPQNSFIAPFIFGIGTSVPVLVFTILLASGSKLFGKTIKKFQKFEKYSRIITGSIFIIIGIYYTLTNIFEIKF